MSTKKPLLQIVWLKRDLRLEDNEAIFNALTTGDRTLFLYAFETILLEDNHYSERHWNFIRESIKDLNDSLKPFKSKVLAVEADIISIINQLMSQYTIRNIYSHQETGILVTYNRDKSFKRFCKNNLITWHENIHNGVQRGLKNRELWTQQCNAYFEVEPLIFSPSENQLLDIKAIKELEGILPVASLDTPNAAVFQKGGRMIGLKYLDSFLTKRNVNYMFHISKPELARKGCSRISPYIAWGNLSIREVYRKAFFLKKTSSNKKPIEAFMSRLRWQAHFIQKFEMEHTMENVSINKGYQKLKKDISEHYQIA